MRTVLILLALAVSACGDDTKSAPPKATGPLVVFEHGGGYASQPRRLVVDRQGHARLTITTGTDVSHRAFTLTTPKRDELEQALDAAAGVAPDETPTGCADCFTYSVKADGIDFYLDEVAMQDAPEELQRVVALLEDLSSP